VTFVTLTVLKYFFAKWPPIAKENIKDGTEKKLANSTPKASKPRIISYFCGLFKNK